MMTMKAIRTVLACIRKADNTYNLINHGDKIVIGLSGGKDSVSLLYCLSLYQKFSHTDFIVQPVMLDLGFDNFDPSKMEAFCTSLGYKLIVHDSKEVYKILKIKQEGSHLPCSICSRMKKAAINKVAKELGFNKVAFAHHADDAVETLLMNEIYGARIATFSPKMHLENADIDFIRPFTLVREKDIIRLVKEENLPVSLSTCPADKHTRREDIKQLLNDIYKAYPESKDNFLTMLSNYTKEDLWGKEIYYQINNDGLSLKPVISKDDFVEVLKIRKTVYIDEQHISYEDEFELDKESETNTFLIYLYREPIGTIRYRQTGDREFKLERFAVITKYRHKGYGKEAFNFLVNKIAGEYNPCYIYFHAQYSLLNYYQNLGFSPNGEIFDDANIPHIKMEKYF
ncbi:MAG: GNAT family N-acetyltransferase [Erysipelotrichaceae bacterium]|nr:GNAT family N-acetyltransferase [Erysipelotrichaceae bacterium]